MLRSDDRMWLGRVARPVMVDDREELEWILQHWLSMTPKEWRGHDFPTWVKDARDEYNRGDPTFRDMTEQALNAAKSQLRTYYKEAVERKPRSVADELQAQAEYFLATRKWAEAADAFLVTADAKEELGQFGATRARGLAVRARVAAWAERRWGVRIGSIEQIEILMPGYPSIDPTRKAVRVDLGVNVVVVSIGRNGDVQIEDEV